MAKSSPLLELPAELRVTIFEHALHTVRCRKPLIVLDAIYINSIVSTQASVTAILLTCRLIYKECLPLLYNKALEVSLRGEQDRSVTRACLTDLSPVKDSEILSRLRHLELEISFDGNDPLSVCRAASRLNALANELNKHGKLKTLDLVLYQQGDYYRSDKTRADLILHEASNLKCAKLLGVSRNMASRHAMSTSKWVALRRLTADYNDGDGERFQEISLDYWERRFDEGQEDSSP